ncbi:zinc ribbon domain-containing protein [bacterium]|nr:zinc ribbon domain-containing protein [bacterium]
MLVAESVNAMPIYEYQCRSCGGIFQTLIMKASEEKSLKCPHCGVPTPRRIISRVVYHASERDRLAAYDPGAKKGDAFFKDSRNIGLDAKKRAQRMGVDLGKGFEEKLEKLRTDPGSVMRESE